MTIDVAMALMLALLPSSSNTLPRLPPLFTKDTVAWLAMLVMPAWMAAVVAG